MSTTGTNEVPPGMERWRSRLSSPMLPIGAILLVAAALRLWNIGAGLPHRPGVDEPYIAERAVAMMRTGDFNPHFFDYGGLYIYVELVIACARFLVGASSGTWGSVAKFAPEDIYLWARVFNALLGSATVLVLYAAARTWGTRAALLAAALLAVFPNHVRESHFALTDVPLTFFVTLAFWFTLRADEQPSLRRFAAAGAAAGFAAAVKYNGAVALAMPLAAALVGAGRSIPRWQALVAAVAASGAAFLATAPYTVLDLPAFLDAYAYLSTAYRPQPFASGAWIYLLHAWLALGWVGTLALAGGAGLVGVRIIIGPRRVRWVTLAATIVPYVWLISRSTLIFGRYLLPIVPLLCLTAALPVPLLSGALGRLVGRVRIRPLVPAALAVALLAFPAYTATRWSNEHGRRTTSDVAFEMLVRYVPEGQGIVIETSTLRLPSGSWLVKYVNRLVEFSTQEYLNEGLSYAVTSLDYKAAPPGVREELESKYAALFKEWTLLMAIPPTPNRVGPEIRLYALAPR